MIEIIELGELMARAELVPQAILKGTVDKFVARYGKLVKDCDALDYFEGAAFRLDRQTPFALMHHAHDKENTTTLYLLDNVSDVAQITSLVSKIVEQLDLPPQAIEWQRSYGLPDWPR